jgi:hypothetical protein
MKADDEAPPARVERLELQPADGARTTGRLFGAQILGESARTLLGWRNIPAGQTLNI